TPPPPPGATMPGPCAPPVPLPPPPTLGPPTPVLGPVPVRPGEMLSTFVLAVGSCDPPVIPGSRGTVGAGFTLAVGPALHGLAAPLPAPGLALPPDGMEMGVGIGVLGFGGWKGSLTSSSRNVPFEYAL